jgi:hypothetical protein
MSRLKTFDCPNPDRKKSLSFGSDPGRVGQALAGGASFTVLVKGAGMAKTDKDCYSRYSPGNLTSEGCLHANEH